MVAHKRPLIGISVGDPSGIGPEIVVKSLALEEIYAICKPLVVSDFDLMKDAVRITAVQMELNRVCDPDEGRYEFGCLDVKRSKIAIAGLNPHASEGGLFGDEEEKEIIPAIEAARSTGMNVDGPFPPDTIFSRTRGGEYDAVIA
jgi:4-hydroxy-L-threonine phosphate dehydrogenase PdxA